MPTTRVMNVSSSASFRPAAASAASSAARAGSPYARPAGRAPSYEITRRDVVGQERGPERAAAAVRVPEDVDRAAARRRRPSGDRGDVLELALDGVRLACRRTRRGRVGRWRTGVRRREQRPDAGTSCGRRSRRGPGAAADPVPARNDRDRRPVRRTDDAVRRRRLASSQVRSPRVPDVGLPLLVASRRRRRWRRTRCARRTAGAGRWPGSSTGRGRPVGGPWRGDEPPADPAPDPGGATYSWSIIVVGQGHQATTRPSRSTATHVSRRAPARSASQRRTSSSGWRAGSRTWRARTEPDVADRRSPGSVAVRRAGRSRRLRRGHRGRSRPRPRRGSRSPSRVARAGPASAARSPPGRDVGEDRRLVGAGSTTRTSRRPRRSPGLSVTRSTCGSMWVGAGMARAQVGVERGGTREHRQEVAVAADPEHDQVEHRPAIRLRSPAARARGQAAGAPSRRPARRRSPRSSGTDGGSARTRPRVAGPWPLGPPMSSEDVVERLDVRERVVARHEPVVAPPDVDGRPRDGARPSATPARGRCRPGSSRRSSPSPRGRGLDRRRQGPATMRRRGRRGVIGGRRRSSISASLVALARRTSHELRRHCSVPTATDGSRCARLDGLGEQVDVAAPAAEEVPLERLDAVLPDAHVDGLGLGGDVGPQLGAAPLGEQLDAERRPGGIIEMDRPDDDGDLGRPSDRVAAIPAD